MYFVGKSHEGTEVASTVEGIGNEVVVLRYEPPARKIKHSHKDRIVLSIVSVKDRKDDDR